MLKQAFILIAISCCFVSHFETLARTKHLLPKDARARVKARIDFECTSKAAFAKAGLKKTVSYILRHSERWGIVWANLAFPYDLNGDSIAEYFVPLQCAPIGNCDWGVFAACPVRLLGLIKGESLSPRKQVEGIWSAITTSTHISASESMLTTSCFRYGKYQKCSSDYLVSAYQHNEPAWYGPLDPACNLNKGPFEN
jgi:hypothetical protein